MQLGTNVLTTLERKYVFLPQFTTVKTQQKWITLQHSKLLVFANKRWIFLAVTGQLMVAEIILQLCIRKQRTNEYPSHKYRVLVFAVNVVIWTKEIDRQEGEKCQHKMGWRNKSESRDPPHPDR